MVDRKGKPYVLMDDLLTHVPSLSPQARVAYLINQQDACTLTPITDPYQRQGFPIGVFSRAYEELHYLDMILFHAAAMHEMKLFYESDGVAQRLATDGWRGHIAQDLGMPLDGELNKSPVRPMLADTNEGAASRLLAPQWTNVEVPEKSQLPTYPDSAWDIISKQADQKQAEQEARDERLKKQTENSDEQLRILAAQVEEGKRSQAAQNRSNIFALLLAGAALLVSILTGFWEAEELRTMVVDFFEERSE